jgi:hypothetical protein
MVVRVGVGDVVLKKVVLQILLSNLNNHLQARTGVKKPTRQ